MNVKVGSLTFGNNSKVITQKQNVKKQKAVTFWNHKAVKPTLGIMTFLAVTLLGYGSFAYAFQHKIYPGVNVAGINLGGKTKDEALQLLGQKYKEWSSQKMTVAVGDTKVTEKLTNIGVSYSPGDLADKAFAVGHSQNWFENAKSTVNLAFNEVSFNPTYNISKKKWNNYLNQLSSKIEKKAEDPHLELANGKTKIVLGQTGITLETDKLKDQIFTKAQAGTLDEIQAPVTKSQIAVPDDQAAQITQTADNYLAHTISLTYENQNYVASKSEIFTWLILTKNGEDFSLSLSSQTIAGFVSSAARHIDKAAIAKEVTPAGQGLSEGAAGQAVNQSAAVSAVKAALAGKGSDQIALAVSPVQPSVRTIYPAGTPGLFPAKYIEIVLSKQTLYAFDGQTLVRSFLISSGVASHPSPVGMFAIYSKSRSVLMSGPDYYLPNVQWVNRFYGPYSIHGTYWHSNFGHPMSHGCINATNGDAAFIYTWAPMGTPVVIH